MQFYKPLSYYLFFTLVCTNVLFGAKTDIVILKNGDKVTCELKELQAGKLRVSTDDMGTVYIEWDKIATITATARYEVELQFGSIYFGSLGPAADSRKINVYGDSLTYDLFKAFVVRITPIEDTFIDRLDGSASMGLNYTKANDLAQLILNGDSRYRSRENLFSVSLSSTITEQKDKKTTQYHDLDFKFTRFLDRRWFWGIISRAQQNTEQGIDLRLSLGAGGGRTILQSTSPRM